MIICLEGLSCAGKTTLIKNYKKKHNEVFCLFKDLPINLDNPSPDVFLRHEERKSEVIKKHPSNQLLLVDRYYLSTLVFYTVLEEVNSSFSTHEIYKWLINKLGTTIKRPDCYIYVNISPELSLRRACDIRKNNNLNMWTYAPERIHYWYQRLFSVFEYNTEIYNLDATKDLNTVQQNFNKLIEELALTNTARLKPINE